MNIHLYAIVITLKPFNNINFEDMSKISALDTNESLFFSYYDLESVEFLTSLVR